MPSDRKVFKDDEATGTLAMAVAEAVRSVARSKQARVLYDCVRYRLYYEQCRSAALMMTLQGLLPAGLIPHDIDDTAILLDIKRGVPSTEIPPLYKHRKDDDNALIICDTFLTEVHRQYYVEHDQIMRGSGDVKPDLRRIIPAVKPKFKTYRPWALIDCVILFSGVIPTQEQRPERNRYWRGAVSMSAKCAREFNFDVTHVVARSKGTEKCEHAARTPWVHVVSLAWLEQCIAEGAKVAEDNYRLYPLLRPRADLATDEEPEESEITNDLMAEMDAEIDAALAEDEAGDNSDDDEDAALPDRLLASPSSSSSERGGAEARIGTSYTGHSDMASSSSDDDSDDGGFSSRLAAEIEAGSDHEEGGY